jgi:basic amino acid/polyamine antiporter, APA family
MAFGLLFYVVYRKVFEGTTLTKRVSVSEQALTKQVPEVAFRNILVPIFGTKLDDDIVATAGRLAAAEQEEAGGELDDSRLDIVYVVAVPLTLPLDADLPPEREGEVRRALERAREVAEEYEDVAVSAELVRARDVGAGIVEAARRSGAATEYVLKKAPCRVLLTAPPETLAEPAAEPSAAD